MDAKMPSCVYHYKRKLHTFFYLVLLFLDLYCLVNSYGVCYDMHYTSYSQNIHTLQFGVKVLNYFLWAKNEQNVFGQNITTNKKIG